MVSESKVNEVLTTFYRDFMNELDFSTEAALRGEYQWFGVSENEKYVAQYALEGARNIFLHHFKKACSTPKK